MSKAVYLSERGDDKNDGLSLEKTVLTGKRAVGRLRSAPFLLGNQFFAELD